MKVKPKVKIADSNDNHKSTEPTQSTNKKEKCQNCGIPGHQAETCRRNTFQFHSVPGITTLKMTAGKNTLNLLLGKEDMPNRISIHRLLQDLLINNFHIEEMARMMYQTGFLNPFPTSHLFASMINED